MDTHSPAHRQAFPWLGKHSWWGPPPTRHQAGHSVSAPQGWGTLGATARSLSRKTTPWQVCPLVTLWNHSHTASPCPAASQAGLAVPWHSLRRSGEDVSSWWPDSSYGSGAERVDWDKGPAWQLYGQPGLLEPQGLWCPVWLSPGRL